ncbi:MAG: hypothetical protein WCV56_08645, partial [Candidatus Omnitrophota bacterium]
MKKTIGLKIISILLSFLIIFDQVSFAAADRKARSICAETLSGNSRFGAVPIENTPTAVRSENPAEILRSKAAFGYACRLIGQTLSNTEPRVLTVESLKDMVRREIGLAVQVSGENDTYLDSIRSFGGFISMDVPAGAGMGNKEILFVRGDSPVFDLLPEDERNAVGKNNVDPSKNTYAVFRDKEPSAGQPGVNAEIRIRNVFDRMSKKPEDAEYLSPALGREELTRISKESGPESIVIPVLFLMGSANYSVQEEMKKFLVSLGEPAAAEIKRAMDSLDSEFRRSYERQNWDIFKILEEIPVKDSFELLFETATSGPVNITSGRAMQSLSRVLENYSLSEEERARLHKAVLPFALGVYETIRQRFKGGDSVSAKDLPAASKYRCEKYEKSPEFFSEDLGRLSMLDPQNEHYLYGIAILKHCGREGIFRLSMLENNPGQAFLGLKNDDMTLINIKNAARAALGEKKSEAIDILLEELCEGESGIDPVDLAKILDGMTGFSVSHHRKFYGSEKEGRAVIMFFDQYFRENYPTFVEFVQSPFFVRKPKEEDFGLILEKFEVFERFLFKFGKEDLPEMDLFFRLVYKLGLPQAMSLMDLWFKDVLSDEFVGEVIGFLDEPEGRKFVDGRRSHENFKYPDFIKHIAEMQDPRLNMDLGVFLIVSGKGLAGWTKTLLSAIASTPQSSDTLMVFLNLSLRLRGIRIGNGEWLEEELSEILNSDIEDRFFDVKSLFAAIPYYKSTGNVNDMLNAAAALDDDYRARFPGADTSANLFRYIRVTVHRNQEDITAKLDLTDGLLEYFITGEEKDLEKFKRRIPEGFLDAVMYGLKDEEVDLWHTAVSGALEAYNKTFLDDGEPPVRNIRDLPIDSIERVLLDEGIDISKQRPDGARIVPPIGYRKDIFNLLRLYHAAKSCYSLDAAVAERFIPEDIKSKVSEGDISGALALLKHHRRELRRKAFEKVDDPKANASKISYEKRHVVTTEFGGMNYRNIEEYHEPKLDAYILEIVYEAYSVQLLRKRFLEFRNEFSERSESGGHRIKGNNKRPVTSDDIEEISLLMIQLVSSLRQSGLASVNLLNLASEFLHSDLDANQMLDLISEIRRACENINNFLSVRYSSVAPNVIKGIRYEDILPEYRELAEKAGFTREDLERVDDDKKDGKFAQLAEFLSNIAVSRILAEEPEIEMLEDVIDDFDRILRDLLKSGRNIHINKRTFPETLVLRTYAPEEKGKAESNRQRDREQITLGLAGNKFKYQLIMSGLGFNVPPAFCLTTDLERHTRSQETEVSENKEIMDIVIREILELEQKEGKFFPFDLEEMRKLDPVYPEIINRSRAAMAERGLYPEPRDPKWPTPGESPVLLVSVRSGSFAPLPGLMETMLNVPCNRKVRDEMIDRAYPGKFVYDTYWRYLEGYASAILRIDKIVIKDVIKEFKMRNLGPLEQSVRYLSDSQYLDMLGEIEYEIDNVVIRLKTIEEELKKTDKRDAHKVKDAFKDISGKVDLIYYFGTSDSAFIAKTLEDICSGRASDARDRLRDLFMARVEGLEPLEYNDDPFRILMRGIEAIYETWDSSQAEDYRRLTGLSERWKTPVIVQVMKYGSLNEKSGGMVIRTHDPGTGMLKPTGSFVRRKPTDDIVAGSAEKITKLKKLKRIMPVLYQNIKDMAEAASGYLGMPSSIEAVAEFDPIKRNSELFLLQCVEDSMERKGGILAPSLDHSRDNLCAIGTAACGNAVVGRILYANDPNDDFDSLSRKAEELYTEIPGYVKDKYKDKAGIILIFDYIDPKEGIKLAYIPHVVGALCKREGGQSHAKVVANHIGKTLISVTNGLVYDKKTGTWVISGGATRAAGNLPVGGYLFIDGGTNSPTSGHIYRAYINPRGPEGSDLIEIIDIENILEVSRSDSGLSGSYKGMIPFLSRVLTRMGISLRWQASIEQALFLALNLGLAGILSDRGMLAAITATSVTWGFFGLLHWRKATLWVGILALTNAIAVFPPVYLLSLPGVSFTALISSYLSAFLPYLFTTFIHSWMNSEQLREEEDAAKDIEPDRETASGVRMSPFDVPGSDIPLPEPEPEELRDPVPRYHGKYTFPGSDEAGADMLDPVPFSRGQNAEASLEVLSHFIRRRIPESWRGINIVNGSGGINDLHDILLIGRVKPEAGHKAPEKAGSLEKALAGFVGPMSLQNWENIAEAAKFLLALEQHFKELAGSSNRYDEWISASGGLSRRLAKVMGYEDIDLFIRDVGRAMGIISSLKQARAIVRKIDPAV